MAAPKKSSRRRQSIFGLIGAHWNRSSTVTAIIIGITGSVIGISQALPIIEPYWYVAQYQLRQVMDKQAVATDRQTLFQLQEYLDRAKKDPAAARSPIVQQRILDLSKQIKDTEDRLRKSSGN